MAMSLRLIFMGSPDFAIPALDALIDAGHRIVAVYCQPPRPAGRGQRDMPSAVHAHAMGRGIPVCTPVSLKDATEHAAFAAQRADAAVVAAYGLLLPKPILCTPRLGCINIHASLLPRWRGAAPIQRAILAGDSQTGITIMRMDEGLDTGPMLMADSVPIGPETAATELHDTLAALGARLIVAALDGLAAGCLPDMTQPSHGVTVAPKLRRNEGRLDWHRPAVELERALRALNPWPGTWFEHGGARIKVLSGQVAEGRPGAAPGTVLDDRLTVACGAGALRLTRLQRPGRGPAEAGAFLRGYALPAGTAID